MLLEDVEFSWNEEKYISQRHIARNKAPFHSYCNGLVSLIILNSQFLSFNYDCALESLFVHYCGPHAHKVYGIRLFARSDLVDTPLVVLRVAAARFVILLFCCWEASKYTVFMNWNVEGR